MVRSISSAILLRFLADIVVMHGIVQLEGAFPGFLDVDVGVAEPRVRHEERGQREGHLVGIEPFGRRALALLVVAGLADGDQGDAQTVLVEVFVEPRHLEIRRQQDLVDVRLIPGRFLEDDAQRLLAAVDLERDGLAVLGLDLALGHGGADQALDAGVVDLAGQAEARVRAAAAFGELGLVAEEIVVGVGGGVEEAVDRLRLPPAVEPLAFDPGELGQGVDQLGLGAALGVFLEVLEGRVDVLAIFLVEIESPERLQRCGRWACRGRRCCAGGRTSDRRDSAGS